MATVQLVCWNADEGAERAELLRSAGFDVRFESFDPFPAAFKRLKGDPPDALVIDLSRLPSAGRDLGLAVREAKALRLTPIVFAGGQEEKIARTRQTLPDATYTSWRAIRGALRKALARPVTDPVVPNTRLDGYSGTPPPKKLGIKPEMIVALVDAPDDFEDVVGELPAGAALVRSPRGACDLVLLFVRTRAELVRCLDGAVRRAGGEVWICWPKRASGRQTDLGETVVRSTGLARGLVDYKIAAIDQTWSGLRFTRRKA